MYDLLLALNVAVFILVCGWYANRRCASIFHPGIMVLAVHGFIFVFRPIMARIGNYQSVYDTYGFNPTLEEKMTVIAITMISLVVVMASLVRFAGEAPRLVNVPDDIRERLRTPAIVVALTLGLIAAYSAISGISTAAYDTGTMIMTKSGYKINTTGNGYFTDSKVMLVPITILIAWVFRFRLLSLVPFALFVFAKSATGGRGAFIIAIAALALLYLYDTGRKAPNLRLIGLGFATFVFFAMVGQDRGYAIRELMVEDQVKTGVEKARFSTEDILGGMDFANMEYVEFVVHTVPERTHTYGFFLENLQILTEPVPRVFWPGKPVGSPVKMFDLFDYGTPWGMTLTVAGIGWQGLGLLGVVLYSFVAGAFLAWIYRMAMRRLESPFVLIAYITFLAGLVLFLRDGLLLTIIRSEVFYLAPLALAWLLSGSVPARIKLLRMLGPQRYAELVDRVQAQRPVRGYARSMETPVKYPPLSSANRASGRGR